VQEQIANVGTNLLFLRAGSQNVGGVQTGTDDTGSRSLKVEDIEAALSAANGKIYGRSGAARLLGMKPTTLASRVKALGIGRRD
jgi:transcriptional regulator with GAF, ATPase, and Fis domain